ncbi:predicted protein [Naegleria gruberi]|uniref:Predicted protein n=1 Tax=Naegleria gruberi TaxID=5762 RepID=D2VVD3_NAEGR|nr:uncharacterized protein NAEGRDRAFT_72975 [Naegleria gruberi]EFC39290.1 predicted protein [Naegleria gruberi]|eukprot:XP_002672034.1 predicted protein [Naegleria gruberi strain NEG-M]
MPTKIILIDFQSHHHDESTNTNNYSSEFNLQQMLRNEMMKKSQERTNLLYSKLMILKQIRHSNVPFVPSRKPFDFGLDRDVALAVVSKHGSDALKIIHETLRNDREIILKAVSKDDFMNSGYIGKTLRRDRKFVKELVQENWILLKDMDLDIREDEEICRAALKRNPRAIRYVHNQDLLNNREFMLEIVKQYGLSLEYIGKSLKNDREINLTALNQNPNAFRFVGQDLLYDKKISIFSTKASSMELHIKSMAGRDLKVYVNPEDSFRMIRLQVVEAWGNLDGVRIVHKSKPIPEEDDEKTLKELEINSDSKLTMIFRLRGG